MTARNLLILGAIVSFPLMLGGGWYCLRALMGECCGRCGS